jgi:Protein of unknown function (DUF4038)/Domain of unknown function (DUF5060)/Putative collagen-binding domain of a collagenase
MTRLVALRVLRSAFAGFQSGFSCRLLLCVLPLAVFFSGCGKEESDPISQDPPIAQGEEVKFSQSSANIECYDFVEVTMNVVNPEVRNPFTDITVSGNFSQIGQGDASIVDGFSDSLNGSVFRIRFMPSKPGAYVYSVTYRHGDFERAYLGTFGAVDAKRRGLLRVDPNYSWHFIWEGTGEHFFMNGTTAFLLMGWDNEQVIRDGIDRLHRLGVNRIRLLLDGRTDHFYTEPIKPGNGFRAHLNPWVAQRPDDIIDPLFDYSRFNCPYWQKFERMLTYAREKEMNISVIFGWNDTKVHPAAGSADERRYFRYAAARLAAFANVTWDLGDDLDSFRTDAWTHETGTMLHRLDPYHHLATSHPVHNEHQDRTSPWFSMTSFQQWDRPQHGWMLAQRQQQAQTGRIIPQTNEEYGYEDHYPSWAPYQPPAASADADRRVAWEMSMAGCYQTTGETAKRGTGVQPDTGGGWVNGRGDDTMIMLQGYAHMVKFFTNFEWWKADPHDELVNRGAFCLAEPGKVYAIYLPHGGAVNVKLEPARYTVQWFNPRTGAYSTAGFAEGGNWTSSAATDSGDWVLLLARSQVPP